MLAERRPPSLSESALHEVMKDPGWARVTLTIRVSRGIAHATDRDGAARVTALRRV